MRLKLDPEEARSCCPPASSGFATHLPCSHQSESMSAPCTDPAAERIEYSPPSGPPVQGCEQKLRFSARRGMEAPPLRRLIECSLAIGLPAQGGERTLL